MKIEEVAGWGVDWKKIGHIVIQGGDGWITTACGDWMTGSISTEKPKRICRSCRSKLPQLYVKLPQGKE